MKKSSVERDSPSWPDAFSGIYGRIRYQSYLHILTLIIIAVQGIFLFSMGTRAAAHVYEIHPTGEAVYVGQRESNVAPRPVEAAYVARKFVELLYGWNSSTVHKDLTAAVNLCEPRTLGAELRKEMASTAYIELIRRKRVRSEVTLTQISILDSDLRHFKLRVMGKVDLYPLTKYEGSSIETKPVDVVLVLGVVARSSERLNGLEVVRLERAPSDENRTP